MGEIYNPAGVFGQTATSADPVIVWMVNGSGGSLRTGDVVILATAVAGGVNGTTVTTTTTADDKRVVGVVGESANSNSSSSAETFAASANLPVVVSGPARINIAAGTPAVGDAMATSTTAKVAVDPATPVAGSIVAIALETDAAKDANNTIRCWVKLA